jgi:hypothetical protein
VVVVGSWESIWEVTAGAAEATNIGGLVLDLSPPLEAGAFAIIGTAQNRTAGRRDGTGQRHCTPGDGNAFGLLKT